MTVPSTARRAGPFTGTGSLVNYSFSFKVFQKEDLAVTVLDLSEIETQLVLDSSFNVVLNVDQVNTPGGYVQYAIGGVATALPAGYKLAVTGEGLDFTQTASLPQGGNFSPVVLEQALDRLEMQIQLLRDSLNRSLTLPVTADNNISTALPTPSALSVIGWNSTATGLDNLDPTVLATVVAFSTVVADKFTGDGSTTTFSLTANPVSLNNLDVSVGGVVQVPGDDYTLLYGTQLVFNIAPPNLIRILARYGQALPPTPQDVYYSTYPTTGTGSTYALITGSPIPIGTDQRFRVRFHTTNSTNPTLNRDGTGTRSLKIYNQSGEKIDPIPGMFPTGFITDLAYDGTDYVAIDRLLYRAARLDIDTASTVNLTTEARITDDVRLLNSITVNSFTVQAGRVIRVVARDPFILTASGSVVTGTGFSINVQRGDSFTLRALADNVVEVVNYSSTWANGFHLKPPTTYTTNATLSLNESGRLIIANAASPITLSLPALVASDVPDGMGFSFTNIGTAACTVATQSSNNLYAKGIASTSTVVAPGDSIVIAAQANSAWFQVSTTAILGAGQTYQNVLGSRALSTTYTNSTGKPILLVAGGGTVGADASTLLSINGGTPFAITRATDGKSSVGAAVIPVGATYAVTGIGSLNYWMELR